MTQVIGVALHRLVAVPPGRHPGQQARVELPGRESGLEISSLIYLAAILLVIGLIANLMAQVIVRRFDPLRGARA